MSAPAKLAGFAAVLAVLFGTAALAGGAINPGRGEPVPEHAGDAATATAGHGGSEAHTGVSAASREDAAPAAHEPDEKARPVRGLAVAENGLRIVVDDRELQLDQAEKVRFSITNKRGATVRDFDVEHTKRMHLIVVRRDLTAFQHLHPVQNQDGTWSVPLHLPVAGSYRLFADFSYQGRPSTLATDLNVDGRADLQPLPPPALTAVSADGYRVRKQGGRTRPGEEATLRLTVSKDGLTARTEPYLGAGGHLVALRDGDLAFLHVHPTEDGDRATHPGSRDESTAFAVTFPTAGRYRLFLQFKHEGTVRTVAFTQEVR